MDNREKTEQRNEARLEALNDVRCYSLAELEGVLGVTRRTLFNYIKKGVLKGSKVGGRWKVTETEVRKFVNGNQ